MIKEDYVSFGTAKMLKEKGFDEPSRFWYDNNGVISQKYIDATDRPLGKDTHYPCVTISFAMKWLREVHNKHCDTGYDIDLEWFFQIIDLKEVVEYDYPETKYYHSENETGFNSYEEACEAAIKYTLENLI